MMMYLHGMPHLATRPIMNPPVRGKHVFQASLDWIWDVTTKMCTGALLWTRHGGLLCFICVEWVPNFSTMEACLVELPTRTNQQLTQ